MPTIAIYDLQPVGHSLFDDNESYLTELSSDDGFTIQGGNTTIFGSAASSVQCISLSATSSPACISVSASLLIVATAVLYARRQ
jgi:hypothetical protein